MPLPTPEPGLVINYEFLWSHEQQRGQDEGSKKRPAVIVVARQKLATKEPIVVVALITHRSPSVNGMGFELPPKVKAHLGLDSDRSWVILNELNAFTWPGFDVYPIPARPPGTFAYGFLPPALFRQIRDCILSLDAALRAMLQRDDFS